MSGHSKWSTIKRQKAVTDSKRSAIFTKYARLISVAARAGGGDPDTNFKLRLAIDKARSVNMPNDNIDRAIKSGTGSGNEAQSKEVLYEGFGPGGVAVMVEALTDNPNRTSAEVRHVFERHQGTLGSQNSVSWMFQLRGVTRINQAAIDSPNRESLELSLIDVGAEDFKNEDDILVIISPADKLASIGQALQSQNLDVTESGIEYLPTTTTAIDQPTKEKLYDLFSALEDLDDVNEIFSNEIEN